MKKVTIVIIDSGVQTEHPAFKGDCICGFQLLSDSTTDTDFTDLFGHGTAIYGIIRKAATYADIINIKLPHIEDGLEEAQLCAALRYVLENLTPDIINLSLGVNIVFQYAELYGLCKKLSEKGIVIVSAFDNTGAISYPAAFDCVIGVVTGFDIKNSKEWTFIEDSTVTVAGFGRMQRLAWTEPPYMMLAGSSFACAHITVLAAQYMRDGVTGLDNLLHALKNGAGHSIQLPVEKPSMPLFNIKKAVLFPFNKEMHSLIRYTHLLHFKIIDVYDSKYTARVGVSTRHLLNGDVQDYHIKNITDIEWDSFDTLILGHLDELSVYTGQKDLKRQLITEALNKGKQVYAFDDVSELKSSVPFAENLFYPKVDDRDCPANRYGMLYRISKPVVGVFGTSSQQGKFTLQLKLRELFLQDNVNVGQIGTEPSALLYGMDYVFPMGYGSTVSIHDFSVILYLNHIVNQLCLQNKDIIITGSQSGTVAYDTGNLRQYPVSQSLFLMGTQPDCVLLCVNPFDEIDYIRRTKQFIESCAETEVLALVLFPMGLKNDWSGLYGGKRRLSAEECAATKTALTASLSLPVFCLGDEADMQKLYNNVKQYFQ